MKNKFSLVVIIFVLALIFGVICMLCLRETDGQLLKELPEKSRTVVVKALTEVKGQSLSIKKSISVKTVHAEDFQQNPDDKAAAEAEARVEAFYGLTDKWMEPKKGGVTMKDVEEFAAAFRSVPKDRKDECIHRALNLVPDDNIMLLAGILMDKSEDKEIVETVFNDVLNRDEEVKKPILKQIFEDKTHPCWADTAWIFDVTGEMPAQKK